MKNLVTIALLFVSAAMIANNGPQLFHQGGFLGAKKQASEEGKFQMIEFVAKWCLPCKHMDQNTFNNSNLISYMDDHFVSAKVDIDDFDGFALKQKYNIRFLPSILVLDEDGKVIARYEEAMGPEALKKHLSKVVAKHPKPKANPVRQQRMKKTTPQQKLKEPVKTVIKPEANESSVQIPEQVEPEKTVFITDKVVLQFGVFSSLSNAENLYDQISEYLPSTPEMKPIQRDNKTLYALRYGPFTDIVEAEELKEELNLLGYNCLIKKMEL